MVFCLNKDQTQQDQQNRDLIFWSCKPNKSFCSKINVLNILTQQQKGEYCKSFLIYSVMSFLSILEYSFCLYFSVYFYDGSLSLEMFYLSFFKSDILIFQLDQYLS